MDWVKEHRKDSPDQPYMLWVHYVEPHAPYRLWSEYRETLGISSSGNPSESDRYDTEIAAVDASIDRLLAGIRQAVEEEDLLVVLTADHGESLGEHNYWGHGRYLYEPSLRIPQVSTIMRLPAASGTDTT